MTDLEKRLREYVENIRGKDEPPENYLCWQAADEIERMRAMDWREIAQRLWDGDYASRDLVNFDTVTKLKPAKTASNPKGAGRPKGAGKASSVDELAQAMAAALNIHKRGET